MQKEFEIINGIKSFIRSDEIKSIFVCKFPRSYEA
jgi:hypothetical protein